MDCRGRRLKTIDVKLFDSDGKRLEFAEVVRLVVGVMFSRGPWATASWGLLVRWSTGRGEGLSEGVGARSCVIGPVFGPFDAAASDIVIRQERQIVRPALGLHGFLPEFG